MKGQQEGAEEESLMNKCSGKKITEQTASKDESQGSLRMT